MRLGRAPLDAHPSLEWDDLAVDVEFSDEPIGGIDRLALNGVGVRFGQRRVVRDVNLRVAPGEVVVLIGHNGCGKSSTLRAAFGLTSACGGTVLLDGVDVTPASSRARRDLGAAFVPATDEVFADLTVRNNLQLAAGDKMPRELLRGRIDEVVRVFPGLARCMTRAAGELSGGEQRMVGLGMGLMTQPSLLLLDEPSKHLARAAASSLLSAVAQQARERSMGVLIAEVNVAAALEIGDRVYACARARSSGSTALLSSRAAGPSAWWRMF